MALSQFMKNRSFAFFIIASIGIHALVQDHSRNPSSVENTEFSNNLEDTLKTLGTKRFTQYENLKNLNELNRPGRSPLGTTLKQRSKPILPKNGLLKSPDPLNEVLEFLEKSSDYTMLLKRIAEVWNLDFFKNLSQERKTLENDEALIASLYNLETYIAFSVWIQIQDVEADDHARVYREIITQINSHREHLLENRVLLPGKNDLVESIENTLKDEIKRKFVSSIGFKKFLNQFKLVGKGLKIYGSVGSVNSLVDVISKYSSFYEASDKLSKDLNSIPVPHDSPIRPTYIVPIVSR
jgi:hypothetical protein